MLHILHAHAEPARARQALARHRPATSCCAPAYDVMRAALAGVRRLRFHQPAGLGASRSAHLAQRHEVIAVRLYDPLEMELPDLGLLVIRMPRPASRCSSTRTTAASASASPRLAQQARGGVAHRVPATPASTRWSSPTDDDLVDAIMRFADLRKRRSQLAAGGGMPQHIRSS